ncbi:50S ribosomal protein L7ae-like protein [Clostridium tyrobutyricum]|jgi:large subunit ribosomal protein L7A|uniref:Firmicutes ribosomal L7Ae family protein n=1 Tax=Clostridium tyrobutyricum DIVETGP TaxID=1408889 RepID=W6ND76_CLOTY|nr:ribosomal L7Ae/L30e/S12e/Gadd45 family protein [Clostridium tyrobutyricum]AND86134.1 ribosomal protein L7Ae-like protein [Clostridium tyrobutyricum]ANP70631.1 ribosomal protein L7Ae-like protein [Clostridium tyrobutyricum]MBR9648047.1 ribosomal L7Ae/L30e/S12e/Gadd45 family protein [Clostridium tyrobutyricum]MBV4417506.1 ribosomal L7Ae/L30e/S12e/Gadd45 family protein [Clostridium tyrobutyricum]MBV4422197.1 ribosomal L7Ae/L30e/S12e/Gadd45 family protein [Clostridium tyrobutyricum]
MIYRLRGKKVIGIKQTIKAIKNDSAKIVYIAKDADSSLVHSVEVLIKDNSLEVVYIDTMKELGKLCGIDVGAATAALLK